MEKIELMVNIYAHEGYVNAHDEPIWSKIWTKFYDNDADAQAFIDYQKREFGRYATLHIKGDNKWRLVFDTRY